MGRAQVATISPPTTTSSKWQLCQLSESWLGGNGGEANSFNFWRWRLSLLPISTFRKDDFWTNTYCRPGVLVVWYSDPGYLEHTSTKRWMRSHYTHSSGLPTYEHNMSCILGWCTLLHTDIEDIPGTNLNVPVFTRDVSCTRHIMYKVQCVYVCTVQRTGGLL